MGIDYSILDMFDRFSIRIAAMAWCEIEKVTEENRYRYDHIYRGIYDAVMACELPAILPTDTDMDWAWGRSITRRNVHQARIRRQDFKVWAEKIGHYPKFLFPEKRNVHTAHSREDQLDKAACQAMAQMIWAENPSCTIADMIVDKRISKYANGHQYEEKTLRKWVSGFDPRPLEQKTGRPRKILEKAG